MPLAREDLDRRQLAVLGREWMLHGHLQDRVGMALLLESADRLTMQAVAIAEWMAASPVYTRRMQRALRFEGRDVGTVMKSLQLDIGAPHQFLDFRFQLDDAEHGQFWLPFCGALADVEPMGEQFVHGMCHAIEDPTFDATAGATNPLAQVRPIHRPPRVPSDRVPVCAWRIDVVPEAEPTPPTELEARLAESAVAQLPVVRYDDDGTGGLRDYSGPFEPGLSLEHLSRACLLTVLDEFAVQSHLLLRAYLLEAERALGRDEQRITRLVRGWCGLTAERLRRALDLPTTLDGVLSLLQLHPMLFPLGYSGFRLEGDRVVLEGGAAVKDDDGATWLGSASVDELLSSVVQAAFPTARVSSDLDVSLGHEPAQPTPELEIARISKGATFRFSSREDAAPPARADHGPRKKEGA